jgi:hypothetical protein
MVPVPREYVLDVMRWVLFRAPDELGETTGRDVVRVEQLLSELDEFQRSVLVLIARSVGGDDELRLTDAAAELNESPQAVSDSIGAINRQAAWGRDVITLRPESAVGIHGRVSKLPAVTMRPEIARIVRTTVRSASGTEE